MPNPLATDGSSDRLQGDRLQGDKLQGDRLQVSSGDPSTDRPRLVASLLGRIFADEMVPLQSAPARRPHPQESSEG